MTKCGARTSMDADNTCLPALAWMAMASAATVLPPASCRVSQVTESVCDMPGPQRKRAGSMTSQWPVDPTRGCHYPKLMLGSAMQVGDGPDKRALMGQAREDAQRCVETASMAVGRLSRSNETLSQAVDASVKAVPWPSAPGAPSGPRKD